MLRHLMPYKKWVLWTKNTIPNTKTKIKSNENFQKTHQIDSGSARKSFYLFLHKFKIIGTTQLLGLG